MTVNIPGLLNLPALRQMFGGFAQSRTVEKLAFPASRHSVLWTNTHLNRAIGTAYVPAAGTGDGSPD